MRGMIVALVVALPGAAVAETSQQFDLACKAGKSATRYRIDLARGEACEGTCERVWKMGEASSGQLKLIERVPAYRGDLEERATVNRVTGEYRYYNKVGVLSPVSETGKCEPAPFSGFPQAKF